MNGDLNNLGRTWKGRIALPVDASWRRLKRYNVIFTKLICTSFASILVSIIIWLNLKRNSVKLFKNKKYDKQFFSFKFGFIKQIKVYLLKQHNQVEVQKRVSLRKLEIFNWSESCWAKNFQTSPYHSFIGCNRLSVQLLHLKIIWYPNKYEFKSIFNSLYKHSMYVQNKSTLLVKSDFLSIFFYSYYRIISSI